MSHVVSIDLEIKDLAALARACERLGLELMEGQTSYRWFGRSVGDYPLPEGYTADDLGKCQHAIRVKDNPRAYEIGVAARRDGRPGYTLLYDFWRGGYGLIDQVGQNCQRLAQAYSLEVVRGQARRLGCRVLEQPQSDGSIRLVLQR
jgi:hypothetical protein